jgi:ribosomal protein S18 acetylase RimI-like enzyme
MTTVPNVFITPPYPGHLRPFDVSRDLRAVADLVEQCFRDTIDPDGERYLRQMRSAANNPGFVRWATSVVDQAAMPLSGFVWEEGGRLVGNLSLIPFTYARRRLYLIANVAVHPNFRRKGIARALTSTALEHARRRNSPSVWLHVREDNEAANRLYTSMGFQERTRRTTWHYINNNHRSTTLQTRGCSGSYGEGRLMVGSRRPEHWQQQRAWLEWLYPNQLSWHFPLDIHSLNSGVLASLYRLLTGNIYSQWSITRGQRLLGVATRQRSTGFADYLWLALPPDPDQTAVETLLSKICRETNTGRSLTLDFPARFADDAIRSAGFQIHQTLTWMEISLPVR